MQQMGSMGVYAGLIYNDYFSLGLDLFGSNYTFKSHESGAKVIPCPVYVAVAFDVAALHSSIIAIPSITIPAFSWICIMSQFSSLLFPSVQLKNVLTMYVAKSHHLTHSPLQTYIPSPTPFSHHTVSEQHYFEILNQEH